MFLFLQFIQLRLDPASGNTVPASGNGSVTQGLNVTNNQQGQVYEDLHPLLPVQLLYIFSVIHFSLFPYGMFYNG